VFIVFLQRTAAGDDNVAAFRCRSNKKQRQEEKRRQVEETATAKNVSIITQSYLNMRTADSAPTLGR